jgi:predicted permease
MLGSNRHLGGKMSGLLHDLRYAVRQLRKAPAFTVAAVVTLGLGIGANTAMFSVMNAVLLRSLPVPEPDRVLYLHVPTGQPDGAENTGNSDTSFSYSVFQALRERHDVFSDVIASAPLAIGKTSIRFGSEPELAEGEVVSGNFFSGLGVKMARGRGFTQQDESAQSPVAVLSYQFWTRRFNRDPEIIGKTLYVNGVPETIAGIAAEGFDGLKRMSGDTDFWISMQDRIELNAWGQAPKNGKTYFSQPKWWSLLLTARLAPGITPDQAVARVQPLFKATAYAPVGPPKPGTQQIYLTLIPAKGLDSYIDDYKRPLSLLMALVGLVLFIACANVALLLVARNQARQREFSLRLAIGARRGDLFRQLLTESILLVLAGGALAWLFAVPATAALAAWSHLDTSLHPDTTVLLFTLGVLIAAALAFGLAPLYDALSVPVGLALKSSTRTATQDKRKSRFGRLVVALQIALCVVLLVAAGLLLRTLRNLENVPLGIRTQGLLVFGVDAPGTLDTPQKNEFYQRLLTRVRVLPGIDSATLVENRPGTGWSSNNEAFVDGVVPNHGSDKFAPLRSNNVGPDFFHVMGIPILQGRGIEASDTAESPRVAVVNETFAQRYLPNQSPLGHQVGPKGSERTIVGVVRNNKFTSMDEPDWPMMWIPYTQLGVLGVGEMHVEMRVNGDPISALPNAERAVHELDPNLPLRDPMTQQEQFEESIAGKRLFSRLAVFFGLLAGLLVATGLYGTLAYRVSHRTVEIGVRLAVGAQRGEVLRMILCESLVLAAGGVALGLPLAVLASRLLRAMLFGVTPNDVLTFAGALLVVIVVAASAAFFPARRAASTDPMQALRTE